MSWEPHTKVESSASLALKSSSEYMEEEYTNDMLNGMMVI